MNLLPKLFSRTAAIALLGLQLAWLATPPAAAQGDEEDPPARAARLTALSGDVGFRAAQDQDWDEASPNRPLTNGDALDLGSGARAELDLGGGQVRLGGDTRATVDRLDDQVARIHVEEGSANLRVEQHEPDPAYEIETPRFAFIPSGPGEYRVDVDGDGTTTLSVYRGAGTMYGEKGARYEVRGNQSYEFSDPGMRDVAGGPLPKRDAFDRWVDARDGRYEHRPAREYVSEGVVGWDDLDDHGRWETVTEYGPVWYPRVVVRDWAPYRYGHWEFIPPWGWTWIDDAPWGYAPFHYGRWVHWHGRWGWVPGPRHVRPVYAPALVVFVGGPSLSISLSSGPPVGWFPLGPRDVYCPPYRTTRRYFTQVNVTNVTVNHTVINNVYEDVHVHRHGIETQRYAYRGHANATTVVSREDFGRGRRLGQSRVDVDADQLARANLTTAVDVPDDRAGRRTRRDGDRSSRWDRSTPGRDRETTPRRDANEPAHRVPPRLDPKRPAGNPRGEARLPRNDDDAPRATRPDRDRNGAGSREPPRAENRDETRRDRRNALPREPAVGEPARREPPERGLDRSAREPAAPRAESRAQRESRESKEPRGWRTPEPSREERPARVIEPDRPSPRHEPQIREERAPPRSFERAPREERRSAPPREQMPDEPRMQRREVPQRQEMPQGREMPQRQEMPQQMSPPAGDRGARSGGSKDPRERGGPQDERQGGRSWRPAD